MKKQFTEVRFSATSLDIIAAAEAICAEYEDAGYDLSLRQLYYQFVSRQPLPYEWANTEQNYKRLGAIISDARLAGRIDWQHIRDRGRTTTSNPHWNNPGEILDSAAYSFRIDLWRDQPCHVELMVEKQALEGVLQPVCRRLDIPFTANKGYGSSSLLYDTGRRLARYLQLGKAVHIFYLGDHDPSGMDMTRDVAERLSLFAEGEVEVHRVALNMDQVEEYTPPENPTKLSDSRATGYLAQMYEAGYGDGESYAPCWELDALEPHVLVRLVEANIAQYCDEDRYQRAIDKQEQWRGALTDLAKAFKANKADVLGGVHLAGQVRQLITDYDNGEVELYSTEDLLQAIRDLLQL